MNLTQSGVQKDFFNFVITGKPDRVCMMLQVIEVIEMRMIEMYSVQIEPSVLKHMIDNDDAFDTNLISECAHGLADDDLWSLTPVRELYDRVLRHYTVQRAT